MPYGTLGRAFATMILHEKELFKLEDPLYKYLPSFLILFFHLGAVFVEDEKYQRPLVV